DLPARFVIHTVGPIWQGGSRGEARALRNCYVNTLRLAEEHGLGLDRFDRMLHFRGDPPQEQRSKILSVGWRRTNMTRLIFNIVVVTRAVASTRSRRRRCD